MRGERCDRSVGTLVPFRIVNIVKRQRNLEMSEELEFTGSVVGEKFCVTLDDDFVEIEVDDPAEGIAISIKRADAIALAHAILRRYPD
jgi:hypothetical protein